MPLKSPTRQRRKGPPPGETGQESLYLRFLSEKQVPVTVKLRDGEVVYGWIEYFDDRMIRLTREGKPNLFIYKGQIRTISESFRSIDARRRERNRGAANADSGQPVAIAGQTSGNLTLVEATSSFGVGFDDRTLAAGDSSNNDEEPADA